MEYLPVEEQRLPLANHAEDIVVEDDDDERELVGHGGRHLVHIHMEAAVACESGASV